MERPVKSLWRITAVASLLVLATGAPAGSAAIRKPVEAYRHVRPFPCNPAQDQFVLDAFRTTGNCGGIAVKSGPGWRHYPWPYNMVNNDYWYVTRSLMNGTEFGTFSPTISRTGLYELWANWRSSVNRSPAIPFTVHADDGNTYLVTANQRRDVGFTAWGRLGTFRLNARPASATPRLGYVKIANGTGKACVDAVYFKYVGPATVEDLRASHGTVPDAVVLKWTAGHLAKSYVVYRNQVKRVDMKTWTRIGWTPTNTFRDATAADGVKYYYKVRAYSTFRRYSDYSRAAVGYR